MTIEPLSTALIFPGQGSQYVGMCAGLVGEHPAGRAALEEADAVLGGGFGALMRGGPIETLTLTENAQPAILAVSVAWLRVLEAERPALRPAMAAGHSLGEYSALVAAGSLGYADALRLVRLRGRAMQAAVPAGEGSMAAVRGLDAPACEAACAATRAAMPGRVVEVAAINCPGQIVLAGHVDALDAALVRAEAAGARAARRLKVSAPFHSSLLTPAGEVLAEALAEVELRAPAWPVYQNVTGLPVADPAAIRENLVAQVSRVVLWQSSVLGMRRAGAERFIEVGPGRALAGLNRKIDRAAEVHALDRAGALEKIG